MSENTLLQDPDIYNLAMEIGEDVWNMIEPSDLFAKKTLGAQYVAAADSIAATIAEGYGRYFFRDRKQFLYYARGSMMETMTWSLKWYNRKLISSDQYELVSGKLKILHFKLNTYIKKIKQNIITDKE